MLLRTLITACLLSILFSCGSSQSQQAASDGAPADQPLADRIEVTLKDKVVVANTKRFGINISGQRYWGPGQLSENIFRLNPGFEGTVYRTILTVSAAAGNTSFQDQAPRPGWGEDFWTGAEYEVIFCAARGRKGTVKKYRKSANDDEGCVYELADQGQALQPGDWVVLRKRYSETPPAHWWITNEGGNLSYERQDLPPQDGGTQCLRIEARGSNFVSLKSYADTNSDMSFPFISLQTPHKLRFWLKGEPKTKLFVSLRRQATPMLRWIEQDVTVSDQWRLVELPFTPTSDTQPGSIELAFDVREGSILIDAVGVVPQTSNGVAGFREPVVTALKELNPGIVRYWVQHLGDSLDNLLASPFERAQSAYSYWNADSNPAGYAIPEYLALCQTLGADPWIVVPTTFSETEIQNLIGYLAGDAEDAYGKRRNGPAWTSVFNKIYLEFGNEAWNAMFRGGTIEDPHVYGTRANHMFAAAQQHPAFSDQKFELIIGGQTVWIDRNQTIATSAKQPYTMAQAPYLYFEPKREKNLQAHFERAFDEVVAVSRDGMMRQNYDMLNKLGQARPMAIYEVNLHTTHGQMSLENLNAFTPSAGGGMAVGFHMLNMLKQFEIRAQCFYTLDQFWYRRDDGSMVRLWGIVRDMRGPTRPRPAFEVQRSINQILGGDLLQTQHRNRLNSAPFNDFTNGGRFSSFAFRKGKQFHLVLINLTGKALPIDLKLPTTGVAQATLTYLDFPSLESTNEESLQVTLKHAPAKSFTQKTQLDLPAYAWHIYSWKSD